MYLGKMSGEQKELFLDLSICSMDSDGVIDEREKMLVKQYCEEMNISYRAEKKIDCYEDILKRMKEISTEEELKQITVELLALMYADENFAEEEHELLMCLKEIFLFDVHVLGELMFATRHLLLSYKMLEKVVKYT